MQPMSSIIRDWFGDIGIAKVNLLRRLELRIGCWKMTCDAHNTCIRDGVLNRAIRDFLLQSRGAMLACDLTIEFEYTETLRHTKHSPMTITLPTADKDIAADAVKSVMGGEIRRLKKAHLQGGYSLRRYSYLVGELHHCRKKLEMLVWQLL